MKVNPRAAALCKTSTSCAKPNAPSPGLSHFPSDVDANSERGESCFPPAVVESEMDLEGLNLGNGSEQDNLCMSVSTGAFGRC